MNSTNISNSWRLIGTAILLLILLVLWLMGLGSSISGTQSSCCWVAVSEQKAVPPVAVSKSPVSLSFKADDGSVILSGEVSTEAEKHNAINAATAIFGTEKVIDKLTVWKDSSLPGWWQNLDKVLMWVKSGADFGINQQDKKIILTGSVSTNADKLAQEMAINAYLGSGVSLENQMAVEHVAAKATIAPAPAPAPVQKSAPTLNAGADVPVCSSDMNVAISFKTNSTYLNAQGKKQVEQIIKCLKSPTQVAGHTDNTGDASYNDMLSKARAKAVVDYINKIQPDKGKLLTTIGYGESKPLADNATSAGRAKNRRIEFTAK